MYLYIYIYRTATQVRKMHAHTRDT